MSWGCFTEETIGNLENISGTIQEENYLDYCAVIAGGIIFLLAQLRLRFVKMSYLFL